MQREQKKTPGIIGLPGALHDDLEAGGAPSLRRPNRTGHSEITEIALDRQAVTAFAPPKKPSAPDHISQPGIRLEVPRKKPVPLRWPEAQKEQFRVFDQWHEIAMQVVDQAGKPFRLMAVYRRAMFWKDGLIVASNRELSLLAGHCSEKTVSREVQLHERLGIIAVEIGFRIAKGKRLKTRSIRLAVPDPFPIGISIDETDLHLDTCVSTSNPGHLDTCVSRTPGHPCVPSLLTNEDGGHHAA